MARKTDARRTERWLHPPQQRRSDASLRRILDAAEALMQRKRFSDITVAEIAAKARSSVGVFYSRFPDKLALLHHLDERFAEEAEAALEQYFTSEQWPGRSLAEASQAMVEFLFHFHTRKRGMLKSVILEVRTNPNQRFQQTGKRLVKAIDRTAEFLLNWRHEMAHPDPDRAVRLALAMMISLMRDLIVFSDTTMYQDLLGLDSSEATAVLTDAFRDIVRGGKSEAPVATSGLDVSLCGGNDTP